MIGKIALVSATLAAAGLGAWSYSDGGRALTKVLPASLQPAVSNSGSRKADQKRKPVPVNAVAATARTIPIRLEGVGVVKARSKVAVRTRVNGQLFEAAVKDGQVVRKGDLLFRLDPRPFEVLVTQAEANIARDKANYEKAVSDLQRFKSLASKGISPKQREEDTEALVTALAATVRASEAALELTRLNLEYATIRSPIDGRVGNLLVSAGNMVRDNDVGPLLVITELSPVYVTFALPEQHLDDLRKRMSGTSLKVDVTTMGGNTSVVRGNLFFINNEVDTATGTIQVQAQFANEDLRLIPGQFARASVLLEELKDVVTVPTRAVQINRKGHYVWVANPDGTVRLKLVTVGPDVGDVTAITSGLKAGETVVTDGQLRLFPGARVTGAGDKKGGGPKDPKGDKGGRKPGTEKSASDQAKVKS